MSPDEFFGRGATADSAKSRKASSCLSPFSSPVIFPKSITPPSSSSFDWDGDVSDSIPTLSTFFPFPMKEATGKRVGSIPSDGTVAFSPGSSDTSSALFLWSPFLRSPHAKTLVAQTEDWVTMARAPFPGLWTWRAQMLKLQEKHINLSCIEKHPLVTEIFLNKLFDKWYLGYLRANGTAVVEPADGVAAGKHAAGGHRPQPHLASLAFRTLDLHWQLGILGVFAFRACWETRQTTPLRNHPGSQLQNKLEYHQAPSLIHCCCCNLSRPLNVLIPVFLRMVTLF